MSMSPHDMTPLVKEKIIASEEVQDLLDDNSSLIVEIVNLQESLKQGKGVGSDEILGTIASKKDKLNKNLTILARWADASSDVMPLTVSPNDIQTTPSAPTSQNSQPNVTVPQPIKTEKENETKISMEQDKKDILTPSTNDTIKLEPSAKELTTSNQTTVSSLEGKTPGPPSLVGNTPSISLDPNSVSSLEVKLEPTTTESVQTDTLTKMNDIPDNSVVVPPASDSAHDTNKDDGVLHSKDSQVHDVAPMEVDNSIEYSQNEHSENVAKEDSNIH